MTPWAPTVGVSQVQGSYPQLFPFNPEESYPEYRGEVGPEPNPAYRGVRNLLHGLGLDRRGYGTAAWNPLGELIQPGQRVFIKPNWVTHEYRKGCGCAGDLFSVITHSSVLRAVADYVALALKGRGEIVIGDNPCIDANFAELMRRTQARGFEQLYTRGELRCRVLDLRPQVTEDLAYYGSASKTSPQPGDPEGERLLNLGRHSFFVGQNPLLFRGVFTSRWETIRNHYGTTQRYSISKTIWDSDVYISVPKLKSHHKVGATLNVKGLVGINYNKNLLVHWRVGFPAMGGDEYPVHHRRSDPLRLTVRHLLRDLLPERAYLALRTGLTGSWLDRTLRHRRKTEHERYRGAWEGNDTCWRMAADLYRLFIKDATGHRAAEGRTQRTFSVVDGVTGGQHNGPFCPKAVAAGTLLGGTDLLAVDAAAVRLMDYHPQRVAYVRALLAKEGAQLTDIRVLREGEECPGFFKDDSHYLRFEAPEGWPSLSTLKAPPGIPGP